MPREFPKDAAATTAAAAASASEWTESVSFIADIGVRRLRLRPMTIAQGEEVHVLLSRIFFLYRALIPALFQVCLGSVDVCDARIQVHTRAAPPHPSWLDTESQVSMQRANKKEK